MQVHQQPSKNTDLSAASHHHHHHQQLIGIPLKMFEISHMHTYEPEFIKCYTRAMILIDMEYTAALQAHREVLMSQYQS